MDETYNHLGCGQLSQPHSGMIQPHYGSTSNGLFAPPPRVGRRNGWFPPEKDFANGTLFAVRFLARKSRVRIGPLR